MAKIKFGMMMTDARGKLGGQVFSKNRSGAYVRTKVTPGNPQTTFQSVVRALFGAISAAWSALTDDERNAWNASVDDWISTNVFGDSLKPSGKNLHHKLNQTAQLVGYDPIALPPAKETVPENVLSGAIINTFAGTISYTGVNTTSTAQIVTEATAPLSAGTKFVKNRLRVIHNQPANDLLGTLRYNAYVARYGVPAAGANVFVGVRYVLENGQSSILQVIKATVVDA